MLLNGTTKLNCLLKQSNLMLKQCRQRIEKVHHFLTEYERKAKEMSMLRAREKLGAFFHMAEERQHLAEISKALHHKIETYSQSYQLPSEQLLDELIEGYGKTYSDTRELAGFTLRRT